MRKNHQKFVEDEGDDANKEDAADVETQDMQPEVEVVRNSTHNFFCLSPVDPRV